MAGQIQLTFLLVIVACMVHSAPHTVDENLDIKDIEIRANIDEAVDALLPTIRKFIIQNGMDPMRLIDISENIFPIMPGKLKGTVDLKNGWMQNLSLIKRTDHVTAIYKNLSLTLDMNLGFDVMDTNYEYSLRYLLYKRQGDVNVRLYELDMNVVVTIDLNEYDLSLNSIKFSDVRRYDIKFEGRLLDPLVNILTKVITVVFRNSILRFIEDYAMLIFGAKIDQWNTKMPLENRTAIIDEWLDIVKKN